MGDQSRRVAVAPVETAEELPDDGHRAGGVKDEVRPVGRGVDLLADGHSGHRREIRELVRQTNRPNAVAGRGSRRLAREDAYVAQDDVDVERVAHEDLSDMPGRFCVLRDSPVGAEEPEQASIRQGLLAVDFRRHLEHDGAGAERPPSLIWRDLVERRLRAHDDPRIPGQLASLDALKLAARREGEHLVVRGAAESPPVLESDANDGVVAPGHSFDLVGLAEPFLIGVPAPQGGPAVFGPRIHAPRRAVICGNRRFARNAVRVDDHIGCETTLGERHIALL